MIDKIKVLKTGTNSVLIFFQFLCVSVIVVFFFLESNTLLFYSLLSFVLFTYFICYIKLIKARLDVIDLYFVFISFYFLGTLLLYNTHLYSVLTSVGGLNLVDISDDELLKLNLIIGILFVTLSTVLFDVKKTFFIRNGNGLTTNNEINIIFYLFFGLLFSVIGIKYFHSTYVEFLENRTVIESGLISYSYLILIPLYVQTNLKHKFYEKRFTTFLMLIPMLWLLKFGVRNYAFVLFFALMINFQKRGLKFTIKYLLVIVFLSIVMLVQALTRAGLSGIDSFNLLTAFMEFVAPGISSHYYINNPLGYSNPFALFDFILQLLPERMCPQQTFELMKSYYLLHGYNITPIGGHFLFGELFLYFSWLSPFFLLLSNYYFLNLRSQLSCKKISILTVVFPFVAINLSRFEISMIARNVIVMLLLNWIINHFVRTMKAN